MPLYSCPNTNTHYFELVRCCGKREHRSSRVAKGFDPEDTSLRYLVRARTSRASSPTFAGRASAKVVKDIRIHYAIFVGPLRPDEVFASTTLEYREDGSSQRESQASVCATKTPPQDGRFRRARTAPLGVGFRRPVQAGSTKSYAHAPPPSSTSRPNAHAAWRRT
jgi:hypothetical protein